MSIFDRLFPIVAEPEVRESEAANAVVAQALTAAQGGGSPDKLAAIETCAFLWERAFSGGECESLAPWQLGIIGRQLILLGETVWHASGRGLVPASHYEIHGRQPDPERWRYRLTMPAPDVTVDKMLPASSVMHVRIGARRHAPWRGCSPLESSSASRNVLQQVERSLAEEHSGPVGHVYGVPDPEQSQSVIDAIAQLKGSAIAAEQSEMDLPGEGAAGRTSWKDNRIGPQPAQATVLGRESVEKSLLAAAGVPTSLLDTKAGVDVRESWRQFVFASVAPVAKLVSAELRRLGLASEISFSELRASDLAGRARAYKQLTEAGMDRSRASEVCGFGA